MGKRSWVNKQDMQHLKGYLLQHGIPPKMVDEIRLAFINDAVRESNDMKYDRIYAGIALAAHRAFGFGPKRILRIMHAFDDLAGYISSNDEGYDWTSLMTDLRNETGFVVQTDGENRLVFEYLGTDVPKEEEE